MDWVNEHLQCHSDEKGRLELRASQLKAEADVCLDKALEHQLAINDLLALERYAANAERGSGAALMELSGVCERLGLAWERLTDGTIVVYEPCEGFDGEGGELAAVAIGRR